MWPRVAVNTAQHKIRNLLKTLFLLISFRWCLHIYRVAQDNASSSVAQRRHEVGRPLNPVTMLIRIIQSAKWLPDEL